MLEKGISLIKIIIAIFLLLIIIGSVYNELENNNVPGRSNYNEINMIRDKPNQFKAPINNYYD